MRSFMDEIASKLPDGTASRVRGVLRGHRVVVRLSPPRRTKLGDHRPPARGVPHHRITVNEDLNPYAFLMTLKDKDSPVNGTSATMSIGISEPVGGW